MSDQAPKYEIHARLTGSAFDAAATDMQFMPPGRNRITPTIPGMEDEPPFEVAVIVDEAAAGILQAALAEYVEASARGEDDLPFFDFNHEGREASAWPKRFYWAGEDPITGGVRCEVEWSAAGLAAIRGKSYRRFSPSFYVDGKPEKSDPPKEYRVTGAPCCMGGLVNRAAFTRIQPLFSRRGGCPCGGDHSPQPQPNHTMTEQEVASLQAELESLRAENAKLQSRVQELETSVAQAARKTADAAIAAAVKDGKIPADPKVVELWAGKHVADPAGTEQMIAAMAVNPTLAKESIIQAGAAGTGDDAKAVLAKYESLKGDERDAFFARHEAVLVQARIKM